MTSYIVLFVFQYTRHDKQLFFCVRVCARASVIAHNLVEICSYDALVSLLISRLKSVSYV